MMNTFKNFLEAKLNEADAPPPGGGIGSPGALPPGGPPPMGGMGGPPLMPMSGPPPMGGMGMGGPPMGGAPAGGSAPIKLKAYNVWDVIERVLDEESS
jgi:hypothetical protein